MDRAVIALLVGLVACTSQPTLGPPTGSVCPPDGTTLRYATFAAPFMAEYCTRCHARSLVGDDRMGAPTFHDFDSYFGIKVVSDHVDQTSAAGPDAVNDSMPNEGKRPTLAEREQLGEWIACGLPE